MSRHVVNSDEEFVDAVGRAKFGDVILFHEKRFKVKKCLTL